VADGRVAEAAAEEELAAEHEVARYRAAREVRRLEEEGTSKRPAALSPLKRPRYLT
jgi:hypothetical protein